MMDMYKDTRMWYNMRGWSAKPAETRAKEALDEGINLPFTRHMERDIDWISCRSYSISEGIKMTNQQGY